MPPALIELLRRWIAANRNGTILLNVHDYKVASWELRQFGRPSDLTSERAPPT